MKTRLKFAAIILAAFAFAMYNSKKPKNFDWLLGKWQRTNEEQGKTTFENWEKANNSEYNGVGFTIQNNDTISKEIMKIVKIDGKWDLLVKTHEEKEFIKFEISKLQEEKFEGKNDTLSFPKLIKYWKNANKINALVSGDSLELSFEFKRFE